jgi:hypothetical protein
MNMHCGHDSTFLQNHGAVKSRLWSTIAFRDDFCTGVDRIEAHPASVFKQGTCAVQAFEQPVPNELILLTSSSDAYTLLQRLLTFQLGFDSQYLNRTVRLRWCQSLIACFANTDLMRCLDMTLKQSLLKRVPHIARCSHMFPRQSRLIQAHAKYAEGTISATKSF